MKKGVRRGAWGVGLEPRAQAACSCSGSYSGPSPKPQVPRPVNGFSLVAVLFLIVVIASLGAFAMRIGMGQQQTVNYALLGARALAAANSGIEWGAYQAFNASSCAASTTFNLTQASLTGYTVTVTCTSSVHTEDGGVSTTVYRINSRAQAGTYGQPDYVSRQALATFTTAP